LSQIADKNDVVFLALPHGIASEQVNNQVLQKTKIIDLGADFRIHDVVTYEKWYNVKHGHPELLNAAVYGLCEIYRDKIKTSQLIANPGCYTTASILPLYPLLAEGVINQKSIIIDAKSGVSGAGRSSSGDYSYCECNENIRAYKIGSHRHTPEIEQELSLAARRDITVQFTPHLVPMNRGILATIYAELNDNVDVAKIYEKYYGNEFFIRLIGDRLAEPRYVKNSNFIDIGFVIDKRTNRIIITSAIDNLLKGAAGQAVQNMNIMFGLNELVGLSFAGDFPI